MSRFQFGLVLLSATSLLLLQKTTMVTSQCLSDSARLLSIENQLNLIYQRLAQNQVDIAALQDSSNTGTGGSSPGAGVGFSARLNSPPEGAYRTIPSGVTQVVPFTDVIVDKGGAYDPVTSTFTCPYLGLFFFSFSIYSGRLLYGSEAHRSSAVITHSVDGTVIGTYSTTDDPTYGLHVQSSTSALIHCQTGEQVYVGLIPEIQNATQLYGLGEQIPSSIFTGFMVNRL